MEVTSLNNEILKGIKAKFLQYKKDFYLCEENETIEIPTDYRDRQIDRYTLKDLFEAKNPEEAFNEMLFDMGINYCDQTYYELMESLESLLTEEESDFWSLHPQQVEELVSDIFTFAYDPNDFNDYIKCNVLVNLAEDKALYYDDVLQYNDKKFHKNSTMLWLANTQGKAGELKKAVERYTPDRKLDNDPFVNSCIEELENLNYSTGTLTFLVEIPLLKIFKILSMQRQGEEAKLVFSKDTMCGLFDPVDGAGSLLEVQLNREVRLPIKNAIICIEGTNNFCRYDVDEVYGLTGSCWIALKDISLM